MGPLDIKSDQTSTVLEPEQEIASIESESAVDSPTTSDKDDVLDLKSEDTAGSDANELIEQSPHAFDEDDVSGPDKKLFSFASCSSSVSSTDSMLEDPFQDSDYERSKSSLNFDQLATEHGEKDDEEQSDSKVPASTLGSTGIGCTSETPPVQVMERSPTQKYRIPSYVFARKKSAGPDWGMASNESLFSIQMGGMSFCTQESMLWKSGELSLGFAAEPSTSGQPINFSYENQLLGGKTTEVETIPELDEMGKSLELGESDQNDEQDEVYRYHEHDQVYENHEIGQVDKNHKVGEAGKNHEPDEIGKSYELGEGGKSHESSGVDKTDKLGEIGNNHVSSITDEHGNPVLRDHREDQGSKSVAEERTSHFSAESGESTKSFAFPILTADTDKGHSARMGGPMKAIPETEKTESPLATQPESPQEPEKQPPPSGAKADAPATTWTKCFPCFGCCTFCS